MGCVKVFKIRNDCWTKINHYERMLRFWFQISDFTVILKQNVSKFQLSRSITWVETNLEVRYLNLFSNCVWWNKRESIRRIQQFTIFGSFSFWPNKLQSLKRSLSRHKRYLESITPNYLCRWANSKLLVELWEFLSKYYVCQNKWT